jgi:3-oxoacyl-[acyl-carrier-protein] synthase-3
VALTPYGSRFESLGLKLPKKSLTTEKLLASCKHRPNIDLERLTGIHKRYTCTGKENSLQLALGAAKDCLEHSDHKAEDIEMVINCSISRFDDGLSHRFEPTFSLTIKEEIGAPKALNFDISNACAGMMTGVFIIDDFIRRGVIKCGMVVSGEYITSLSTNAARDIKTIASKQLASLTVGDAGAAVILERTTKDKAKLAVSDFTTLAMYSKLCIGKPCSNSPGAQMFTKARKIHRVAIADSPPILLKALERSGLTFEDIDYIIPHQTSERAIRSGSKRIAEKLGVEIKNLVLNLKDYGNTASTTHFVAMYKLLNEGKLKKGDNIMLTCFASGLVVGVVIFTMDELVEKYGSKD